MFEFRHWMLKTYGQLSNGQMEILNPSGLSVTVLNTWMAPNCCRYHLSRSKEENMYTNDHAEFKNWNL